MIAEGNETPGGESGGAAEGRGRRSEGDLLAERRARRAAESGEHALTLRAEAAEATVRTLETHVASLQQRLADAEQESRRIADLLDAERAPRHGERPQVGRHAPTPREPALERELERASQREYAEQRLRVEAEDRSFELQREARAEIERLNRRLSASERETQALGTRLEVVQRELAEAEQTVATERAAMQQTERTLRARVSELEGATLDLHGALEAERAARRRAERLLEALRDAQRSALALLGGLADTIAHLREAASPATAASSQPPSQQHGSPLPATGPGAGSIEPAAWREEEPTPAPTAEPSAMQQAAPEGERPLAPPAQPADEAATPAQPAPETPAARPVQAGEDVPDSARSAEMAQALAAAVERLRARVEEQGAPPVARVATRPPHKHSMSLITRSRLALRRRRERRKQRRER